MGGTTDTWTEYAKTWAAIWPLRGSTLIDAKQLATTITHRITIRHQTGIKPYWRLLFGDRVFVIESIINPDERSKFLEFMCYEEI
jgi:SPP1 family predicted phage head-tail adaptor